MNTRVLRAWSWLGLVEQLEEDIDILKVKGSLIPPLVDFLKIYPLFLINQL